MVTSIIRAPKNSAQQLSILIIARCVESTKESLVTPQSELHLYIADREETMIFDQLEVD